MLFMNNDGVLNYAGLFLTNLVVCFSTATFVFAAETSKLFDFFTFMCHAQEPEWDENSAFFVKVANSAKLKVKTTKKQSKVRAVVGCRTYKLW